MSSSKDACTDDALSISKEPALSGDTPTDDKTDNTSQHLGSFPPNDALDPRSWPRFQKWTITILFSAFTLISPMSSSMVAPALNSIAEDLKIDGDFEKQMVLSIYLLLYGTVPIIAGPLSEVFGRIPLLYAGNVIYIAFNAAGGAAHTQAQMLVFRALSGFGAGAPLAIGEAVISDLFVPEERGTAIAIYNMTPLLGPSLGPIFGAVITQYLSWRWTFWIMSTVSAVLMIVGFPFVRETYAPVVLLRRQHERKRGLCTVRTQPYGRSLLRSLATALWRPIEMLATEPIIQLLAVYISFLYGTHYIVLATFPTLWTDRYGESILIGGLNYIALGLGFLIGSYVCAVTIDRVYKRLAQREEKQKPEYKLPILILTVFLVPAGLLIYAWTAQYRIYWIAPDIGGLLFEAGVMIGFQCSMNYLIDTYTKYTASAVGAVIVLRGIAGFGFPLFAPYLYDGLDYGWGNSVLAFVALVFGGVVPGVLWQYGEKLRLRLVKDVE